MDQLDADATQIVKALRDFLVMTAHAEPPSQRQVLECLKEEIRQRRLPSRHWLLSAERQVYKAALNLLTITLK